MASRLLARSKTLTLIRTRTPLHLSPIDHTLASSQSLRSLHSLSSNWRSQPSDPRSTLSPAVAGALGSQKILGHEKILSSWFCVKAQGEPTSQIAAEKKETGKTACRVEGLRSLEPNNNLNGKEVICFSPLEAISTKSRSSGLVTQSLKIKRMELSQKITYALIPALLLISKSSLTTSLLVFSVYWQIYFFFKEIFLDYVHQDVTRTWVLVYFKLLLLILAKDTILDFGLV